VLILDMIDAAYETTTSIFDAVAREEASIFYLSIDCAG
jgi:hypothetical protein